MVKRVLLQQSDIQPMIEGHGLADDIRHYAHGGEIHVHHHYYHSGEGSGFFSSIKNAFSPHGKVATFFEKTVPSALIHTGIPIAGQVLGALGGTALAPESGPVAGMAGSFAGKQAGNMLANKIGKMTGLGVKRKGRFVKGSAEAREHMARIRKMKGGELAPRSRNIAISDM